MNMNWDAQGRWEVRIVVRDSQINVMVAHRLAKKALTLDESGCSSFLVDSPCCWLDKRQL
jgi:hypothetical protein